MANPLDWAARAILQINGMSPEEVKQKARQLKKQAPKKPMPKANTTRSAVRPTTKPAVRQTRVNGRVKPGAVTRPNQAGQAKPVRQGPRTSNVRQQVDVGPRSAQKPDGPIGPNSRYTPKSKQQPDGKAPSTNVRKLQQAAKTKPQSPSPKPAARPGPGTSSRPLGTADVGPKGPVGRLGQRTGMTGNNPRPKAGSRPVVKGKYTLGQRARDVLMGESPNNREQLNPKQPPAQGPLERQSIRQRIGDALSGDSPRDRLEFEDLRKPKSKAPASSAKPNAGKPKPSDAQKANTRWLEQNSKAARDKQRDLAKKFDAVRNFSTKGTVAALAASNFGNEGEKPDVRARRLGFKDAADQKAKIEAQKRSTAPARTPQQAIKDAKKSPGKPPTASNTRNSPAAVNTPQYRRPKANVSKPSAAQQATDKRDKKKLF